MIDHQDVWRVLVLADTHIGSEASLPEAVLRLAQRADHIIHAGDFTSLETLFVLKEFAPTHAVYGNMDDAQLRAQLDERIDIRIGGIRIGVVHDAGPNESRVERLTSWFNRANLVVFGHTHTPCVEQTESGVWIVNPGSSTQRRRAPTHTVVWIEITEGEIRAADVVHLD